LIASWGQTQVSADIPRFAEPRRLSDGGIGVSAKRQ
jgi:hypothetical protein